MSNLTERASFDMIRYANCWEDADVLLKALPLNQGSAVLSIGSAGDNSFSLLTTDPEMLVAVDLSEVQLHLIELKRAAIKAMEREDFLAFIGVQKSSQRRRDFELIKCEMPHGAVKYWEANLKTIEDGLIFSGKFERYFRFFRTWLLPLIHSDKKRLELFAKKSADEQSDFYNNYWNNKAWRWLFRIFFSKTVMGKYGRDPEFLKQVNVPVHEYIFNKAAAHLVSVQSQDNYFLRMILIGEFGEKLPHYLRIENYHKIRSNLNSLKTFRGYAEDALRIMPPADACNLSNIFEYMSPAVFRTTAETMADRTPAGCRMAYWNLMVPRKLQDASPDKYTFEDMNSSIRENEDLGFFYNGIQKAVRI